MRITCGKISICMKPTNQENNSMWNLDLVANYTFRIKNTSQSINLASRHYRIWFQTFMTCGGMKWRCQESSLRASHIKLHLCMTHELFEDCRSIRLFPLIHMEFQFHQESQWDKQDAKTSSAFNLSVIHTLKSSTDPSSSAYSNWHWGSQRVNPTVSA